MASDGGLRSIFRKHLPSVHFVSIETGWTEQGVPDMNGCHNGVEFWIENKQTHGWTVGMRPEQIGWLMRRRRAGGNCYIAVRRMQKAGPRRVATDEIWIYDGQNALLLKQGGLKSVKPLTQSAGGPARWDWDAIARALGLP